ncbi:MAG: polysaccharide biosynthesis/export family protein [Gemmataceae bacterium]
MTYSRGRKLLSGFLVFFLLSLINVGCHTFTPVVLQTRSQQYNSGCQGCGDGHHDSQGQVVRGFRFGLQGRPTTTGGMVIQSNVEGSTVPYASDTELPPTTIGTPVVGEVGIGPPVGGAPGPAGPLPSELNLVSHPPYTVSPPDILLIRSKGLIPRGPYRLAPLESLLIKVTNTLPKQPIEGKYTINPDGSLNLGFDYGAVRVGGLSVSQAQNAIQRHLSRAIKNPQVIVALEEYRVTGNLQGEHLVRMDGTITLGDYGCVYVAGMTLAQIENVIERHLSKFVVDPEINIDVFAYNSKKYYVIADGGGFGQYVKAFPYTGNETVLDAIEKIGGIPPVGSKKKIWVARPSPCNHGCTQVLPVDWEAITQGGATCTNYQLFPGDRVYIRADTLITIDNWLAKALAPVERIFGITLLGSSTVNSIRNSGAGTGLVVGGF